MIAKTTEECRLSIVDKVYGGIVIDCIKKRLVNLLLVRNQVGLVDQVYALRHKVLENKRVYEAFIKKWLMKK